MMFANLFNRRFSAGKRRRSGQAQPRGMAFESLSLQPLESRLALAFTATAVPLTTNPVTFAWVFAIDDNVDPSGNGRHLYMQSSTDGTPYFKVDVDPAFSNPQFFGRTGCSSVLVISSGENGISTVLPGPGNTLPAGMGTTSGSFAHGFTFQASTTVPNERLIVDLSPAGSRISIESPWNATDGDTAGNTFGVDKDWALYQGYGGYFAAGQVALFATEVNVSSNVTSSSRFTADASTGRASGFLEPVRSVTINAAIQAADSRIRVEGDVSSGVAGQLVVSAGGGIAATNSFSLAALGANVYFEGNVTAPNQTYQLSAANGGPSDPAAYTLTTRSRSTGNHAGTIASTGSVSITMGNPSGGTVDLQTDINRFAFQAGNAAGIPYDYDLTIHEANALQIDSVGSTSGDISVRTGGNLTVLGDSTRTSGGLSLAATGTLTLRGSASSSAGDIVLASNSLTLDSEVTAGSGRSVTLRSSTGATTVNTLVRAGGMVKASVRVASERNYLLTGLPPVFVVDGVTLGDRDRILLKNQSSPVENGIYSYDAGSNRLIRTVDADSSIEMQPGFVVFVREGRSQGAWVFRNSVAPQFNGATAQTPLSFVPATAPQVVGDVQAATTKNLSLRGIPQPADIDGVSLVIGQRVLVKNQSNGAENGIYVVQSGDWFRAADANSTTDLRAGAYVFVTAGAQNGNTGFALKHDAVQVGVTPLEFAQFTQQSPSSLAPWAPASILANADVATIIEVDLFGAQVIDGVAVVAGDYVLVKNQINAIENGLYQVVSNGPWTRVGALPPRGATVYVERGVKNGGTGWEFDDSSTRLTTLAVNSPNVTGFATTDGLVPGMLVIGEGIPSGTTIVSVDPSKTSLRLSSNARLTGTNVPLTFTATDAVTAATPIVFIPFGGVLAAASATAIDGSSSLQGSAALLAAGLTGGAAASIDAQTKVGRLSASAPGRIGIVSSTGVELEQIRTTTAGAVNVSADGTMTVLNVSASGSTTVPGDISLSTLSGHLVAEGIATNRGNISLASINENVFVTKARFQTANVSSALGNVSIAANRPTNTPPVPKISIDGRVTAQGTGGVGDVSFTSNYGRAHFSPDAIVTASDTLKIDTRASTVSISGTPQIAAAAIDLTSQFGASTFDSRLGSYQIVTLNRTDAGDIDFASNGSLVVRGATTAAGFVRFRAPEITVTGEIQPNGVSSDITLDATAGDLRIDSRLTSPRDIGLSSTRGITTTSGVMTPLLTATGSLTLSAGSSARTLTKVAALNATLSGPAAVLEVTEADNLLVDRISTAAGGMVTVTAGTPAAGGSVTVKRIETGTLGSVKIIAEDSILDDADTQADILGERAELIANQGQIDVDTDVNFLLARADQRNKTIRIDDQGVTANSRLDLRSFSTTNANIEISSLRSMVVTDVATSGSIRLQTFGNAADILVASVVATGNSVTLDAGGAIREVDATDVAADVTATTVTLAAGRSIDLHLDAAAVAATATSAGSSINLRDDGALAIGDATTGINGREVTIAIGGGLTQTRPIIVPSLAIRSSGGDVTLNDAANDVGTLTVSNPARRLAFRDTNDLEIAAAGITAGEVELTIGGLLTQRGSVTASSLSITSTAGKLIEFNNETNDVDTVSIVNIGNDISFTDRDDVALKTFTGSNVTINAGGALTQPADGAITTSGLFTVNFTGAKQPIALRGLNDLVRFRIDNGTQPVTLNDINGLTVDSIVAGAVTLTVGGTLNQTGAIVTPSLTTSSTGGEIVLNAANDVGTLSASNPGRGITFRDANGLNIAALTGGAVNLAVGGNLTQSGAISTTALRVDASAGDIVLSNAANNVGTIAGTNLGRGFTLANNGTLTQSAGVVAGTFSVSNGAGDVLLAALNDAGNLSIVNGNRAVQFRDSNGVNVMGVTGGNVQVTVGGSLTQSGRIAATDLSVIGAGGSVMLTREDNAVGGVFTASNPSGSVSFSNASGVRAGRVVAGGVGQFNGNVHLKAVNGVIQLADDVVALDDTVKLEARNGTITQLAGQIQSAALVWIARAEPTLNTTATQIGRNLTLPDATLPPIVNNSFGTVTIFDNSAMQGDIVVTAPNAAKVIIAGALTAGPGGRIDLRGVNPGAVIEMRGDGDLQGTQVLVRSAVTTLTWIVSGANASDAGTSLFNVVNRANSVMPKLVTQAVTTARSRTARTAPRAQPPRMSTITSEAATIEVQQSLPVLNVPVTFVTPTTITAAGGAVAGSGLRLGAGASGSRLSNLAFQGFAGTGVELDRVQRATVQGVQVNGGATGISVAGLSTGTRILGSTFRNVQTGLSLTSASRLTFGGKRAGEANRIENAAREGVFATGFATGTQLIKTQFVGGSSAIVTRNVRGLKIIK